MITSWSTNAEEGSGQTETFKVYRPLGSEKYLVVGHDGPRALIPSTLNTFKTSIPVQTGDIIGSDDDNAKTAPNACEFETGNKADTGFFVSGEAADGETITAEGHEEKVLANLTATVVSAPTVSSIAPSTGLTTAATSVTITGTNFTEASAVKFGAVPAASFAVKSDTQITAIAPANATPGAVDTTVTNVAGTSATNTADRFTYTAPPPPTVITCTVPKLKGKKLKAAKKALLEAECKLGKVKGKKSSSAKVKTQKPKPGTVLTAGSKVNVTVK